MPHNRSIAYREELIVPAALESWSGRLQDGEISVSGPCPSCGGSAFGPALRKAVDDEPSGRRLLAGIDGTDGVDIAAACHCGSSHGREAATSCGRYWFVRVSRPS